MLFIYNLIISLIALAANASCGLNKKVSSWLRFQEENWSNLDEFVSSNTKKTIWVHCASIGEYEQIIPLVKIIKEKHQDTSIAVTFFSPSGVDFHKNNEEIDFIGFIPIDTKAKMKKWINILNPYKIIVVKNEWWPNMMYCHDIPMYHICVNSLPKIPKQLIKTSGIHITDKTLLDRFKKITPHILVSSDTKVERALSVKKSEIELPEMKNYRNIIMYGSMWEEDVIKLKDFINNNADYNHIIFPHKIDVKSVKSIQKHLSNSDNIIIIDKMGILKHAYKYAEHIYIGGGFGNGVHNTIEALIYDKPVSIGPNIGANKELFELVDKNLIYQIKNDTEFEKFIIDFDKPQLKKYFTEQANSSIKIYNFIFNDN